MAYDPNTMDWRSDCGLPGPEEIAEACERIRARWSAADRRGRIVEPVERLEVVVISMADVVG